MATTSVSAILLAALLLAPGCKKKEAAASDAATDPATDPSAHVAETQRDAATVQDGPRSKSTTPPRNPHAALGTDSGLAAPSGIAPTGAPTPSATANTANGKIDQKAFDQAAAKLDAEILKTSALPHSDPAEAKNDPASGKPVTVTVHFSPPGHMDGIIIDYTSKAGEKAQPSFSTVQTIRSVYQRSGIKIAAWKPDPIPPDAKGPVEGATWVTGTHTLIWP